MSEINLLASTQPKPAFSLRSLMPILVKLAVLVLILLLGFYGLTWYRASAAAKSVLTVQQQIAKEQTDISKNDDRNELLTRQLQLADLKKILANHLYWSKFFDKALPAITLKSATYTSIGVQSDGTITLQVSVPTYSDLDKFLQVFDIADFNKDFSDIQIQAISKSQDGNGLMTNFKIVAKYDTKSISYRELNKQSTAQ